MTDINIPIAHLEDLLNYLPRNLGQDAKGAIPVYLGTGLGFAGPDGTPTGWGVIQPTTDGFALVASSSAQKGLSYAPGSNGGNIVDQSVDLRHLKRNARPGMAWAPTSAIAQTTSRLLSSTGVSPLSLGRLSLFGGLVLPRDMAVSNVVLVSNATPATAPTHQWICLIDPSDNSILRKSTDLTTTAWAANSQQTFPLTSSYMPNADKPVWLGVVVTGGAVPGLNGSNGATALSAVAPMSMATANTGLTDPASFTALGTLTGATAAGYIYAYVT